MSTAAAAIFILGIAPLVPAQAASPSRDVTWTEQSADGASATRVVLHFPNGAPKASEIDQLRSGSNQPMKVAVAAGTGPQGAWLYCNTPYSYSSTDATWTFQHSCGGSTGPWGINVAAKWCAIATGSIAEAGMDWTNNGRTMGRQASHFQGCGYQLHGNYNPDYDYDWITYADSIQFPFRLGTQTGVATIYVTGSFTSSGTTPED